MRKIISPLRNIGLPIIIGSSGLLSMSLIAYLLQNETLSSFAISPHKIVNLTFTMQMLVLPISLVALLFMYLYERKSFKTFFRLTSSTSSQKSNWNSYGPMVLISFTLGNILLMSFGVASQNGLINKQFFSLLPLVLFFSVTNAWSEEIFSRFVIVAGLHGKIKPVTICWISGIIFGIPHFFGTPSGFFGVITSGLLGWLLAKSVIETKSLGWALLIHFLQDVVIFGAGAMIIAGQH